MKDSENTLELPMPLQFHGSIAIPFIHEATSRLQQMTN